MTASLLVEQVLSGKPVSQAVLEALKEPPFHFGDQVSYFPTPEQRAGSRADPMKNYFVVNVRGDMAIVSPRPPKTNKDRGIPVATGALKLWKGSYGHGEDFLEKISLANERIPDALNTPYPGWDSAFRADRVSAWHVAIMARGLSFAFSRTSNFDMRNLLKRVPSPELMETIVVQMAVNYMKSGGDWAVGFIRDWAVDAFMDLAKKLHLDWDYESGSI